MNEKPDFGVYHHSSEKASNEARDHISPMFVEAFKRTGIPEDKNIEILDAGCGLGFLCWVAASYFPNARITGVDTFTDGSLKNSSIEQAYSNMRILGINNRVDFLNRNLLDPLGQDNRYDLAVSSLVLHNIGKRAGTALKNIHTSLKSDGYFLNGDIQIGGSVKNYFSGIFKQEFKIMAVKGLSMKSYEINCLRPV